MVTFAPLAIFLGAAATAALAFFAVWDMINKGASDTITNSASMLDRAGVRRKPEEIVITWVVGAALLWILSVWIIQPSVIVGILLLPVAAAVAGGAYWMIIQSRLHARTEAFLGQFETVLRLMASGLRSGLGLQQTLALVSDEMKDPARHEFARIIGQTQIGVSVHDALDDLARRVQTNETLMMARVIRINSQTGGDLGRVLEQLANTIKERRRMRRKVRSLTAEGRMGAIVLGALPVFMGGYILMTQPQMASGLLSTHTGHNVLLVVLCLEILGVIVLNRILKVNV